MRKDRERLQDILEAIEQIERYTSEGKSEFEQNELIQVWILHHLQIIGEAARAISDDFKAQYPQIPWLDIADLRNLIFRVDLRIIWDIVINDVPYLKNHSLMNFAFLPLLRQSLHPEPLVSVSFPRDEAVRFGYLDVASQLGDLDQYKL